MKWKEEQNEGYKDTRYRVEEILIWQVWGFLIIVIYLNILKIADI